MVKILSPKNDVVFQKLFGTQEHKELLISFLNSILIKSGNEEIKSISIEEKRLDVSILVDEKLSILDIYVTTNHNAHINVEIQLINKYNMIERTLFYWSKMYMNQIKKGVDYSKLNKTITINILDFDYIDTVKYHSWYQLYEAEEQNKLTDILEIHFVELNKFNKANKEYNDKLQKWLQFIINPCSEEVQSIMVKDHEIKEAMDILSQISGDEEIVRLAEMREKAILDENTRLNAAKKQGIELGEIKARREDILDNLKEIGEVSKELISIIESESNIDKLKKWLRFSIKCESIEEFIQKIDA